MLKLVLNINFNKYFQTCSKWSQYPENTEKIVKSYLPICIYDIYYDNTIYIIYNILGGFDISGINLVSFYLI